MTIVLQREHWEIAIRSHRDMILQSMMNQEVARIALKYCEKKLAEFPEENPVKKEKLK